MGKEAKIGLAVIMVLLVTFGVVLGLRLTQEKDDTVAQSDPSSQEASAANAESPKTPQRPANMTTPSKMLTAKPPVAEPLTKTPPASQWVDASDSSKSPQGKGQDELRGPTSSSLMPNPPAAPMPVDPYEQYANPMRPLPPLPAGPEQDASQAVAGAGADGIYDPFRGAAYAQAGTTQAAGQSNRIQVIARPEHRSTNGARNTYRLTGTDGQSAQQAYPSAGTSNPYQAYPSPPSTYQQTSPSQYAIPSPPPSRAAGLPTSPGGASGMGTDPRNEVGDYKVQPADNYWTISERIYGCGSYFKALEEHNRQQVPRADQLQVGDVVSVPDVEILEEKYPDLCPKKGRVETIQQRAIAVSQHGRFMGGRTYIVEEGDTLFDIAKFELGKKARWVEILQLNRDLLGDDFDYLTPGMQLTLPGNAPTMPTDSVTERPNDLRSLYQR